MSIFKCLTIIGLPWASYTCLLINMHIFLLGIYLEVELPSPHVLLIKNPPANAGDRRDSGLIPRSGRSSRGGHVNPLQYCL